MISSKRFIYILIIITFSWAALLQAETYVPVTEWTGTHFHVVNGSGLYNQQPVDDPVTGTAFNHPNAVVVWQEPDNNHYISFVVDKDLNRVQVFNTDIQYQKDATSESPPTLTWAAGGVAAAGDFDADQLLPKQGGIVRGSEQITVNDTVFTRVADTTGYSASSHIYTIVWEGAPGAAGCRIEYPGGSLSSSDEVTLEYAYSSNVTTNLEGDIDYTDAAAVVNGTELNKPFEINQTTPTNGTVNPRPTFHNLVSVAFNLNINAANDVADIYVLDSGKVATSEPALHAFQVEDDANGIFHYMDSYDCPLEEPQDVTIAQSGTNTKGAASDVWTFVAGSAPAPTITTSVLNNALITNHTYRFTVLVAPSVNPGTPDLGGMILEISDETIGNTIGFYGPVPEGGGDVPSVTLQHYIPGLAVTLTDGDGDLTIAATDYITFTWTTDAAINDYIFICDSGNDRIKVVKGNDNGENSTSGTDTTYFADDSTRRDYYDVITAGENNPNLTYVSALRSMENSFKLYTNNGGGAVEWTKVSDFSGSGPADTHFMYNYDTQVILFGDGNFGKIPAVGDSIYAEYKPCLDVLDYGSNGSSDGQFDTPSGISARWNNSHAWYDVYVADTGNDRIAKLKFTPASGGITASMDWITSWDESHLGSSLSSPSDVVVISDGVAGANDKVYLFACDMDNDRIIVYRDYEAENEGTGNDTAPTYITTLGQNGIDLGEFTHPRGISVVLNGTDFDVYVADNTRDIVAKFQLGDPAEIDADFSNILSYGYLPAESYTFYKNSSWTYMARNYPDSAFIAFAFSDTTEAGQLDPWLITDSLYDADVTSFTWVFVSTYGGLPDDGSYYLFARLYDKNATLLDEVQSDSLLTIDSNRANGIGAFDKRDGDNYSYVQNNSVAKLNLTVIYPDSVAAVSYTGSFPSDTIEIVSIEEGPAWQSIQNQGTIFSADWDNSAGTFEVNTAVLGTNTGLVSGPASFVVAIVTIQVCDSAINPTSRYYNGAFNVTIGQWNDFHGDTLSTPYLNDLNLRIGYLGDLAKPGGDHGSVPHLVPNPDGVFGIDDMVIFTMAWNGSGGTQDPIADLAPYEGIVPDVWSNPDGNIDLFDLMAFTMMFNWYESQDFSPSPPKPDSNRNGFIAGTRLSPSRLDVAIHRVEDRLIMEIYADEVEDLMSAELRLYFDSEAYDLSGYSKCEFLSNIDNSFSQGYEREDGLQLYLSRLDSQNPGISGRIKLSEIETVVLGNDEAGISISYDLRNIHGDVIETGCHVVDMDDERCVIPSVFAVECGYPNPFNSTFIVPFSLPKSGNVSISVYDVLGRILYRQVRCYIAGHHRFVSNGCFNGKLQTGGIYFLQVSYDDHINTQKIVYLK